MNVTLKQVHKLHDEIRSGRVDHDALQRFLENPNRFREDLGRWGPYWSVEVEYDKGLEAMVKVAKFDGYVNEDYKNFTLTHKKKYVVPNLELAQFDETVTGEVAAERLEADGYVLEDIGVLLAFGAKYPNEQRRRPIVALGSRWRRDGRVHVPCLHSDDAGRELNLLWLTNGFRPRYRFLVSRK